MKILITGCAGFIGFHLSKFLLIKKNYQIVGIDNINNYYSISFKKKRLNFLKSYKNFIFYKKDISKNKEVLKIFNSFKFDIVFHFAAQPGVRKSISDPEKYIYPNIIGFFNILECMRIKNVKKLIYASSSSVYGNSKTLPVHEDQQKTPESFYAFSKYSNEQLAELYSKLYKINSVGLRFFTVFGEWGRPDMFMGKLISSCIKKNFFYLNFYGDHKRDFTYIEDVLYMINKIYKKKFKQKNIIFNICSNRAIILKKIIFILRNYFTKINIKFRKHQLGDVFNTHGSNIKLKKVIGDIKITPIKESLEKTINWYKNNLDFINK